jgi:hypothetical protein
MMDEGLVIKNDGRVVGVAVPVRGGFMFFSSNPDLKALEATVFRRADMITRQVAEILQAKPNLIGQTGIEVLPGWSVSEIDVGDRNVARLHPRQCHTNADPEPPDAA